MFTPNSHVVEQANFKAFSTRETNELLDARMYNLTKSQNIMRSLLSHMIKSFIIRLSVASSASKQVERAVCGEAKVKKRQRWRDTCQGQKQGTIGVAWPLPQIFTVV